MKQPFKVLATSLLAGAMFSSSLTAFAAEEASDSSKQALINELPPLDTGATSTPFKDVKYGTEVFNAVKYFQHTGVINGLTENYFGVNEAIKRVDAAMIVGKSAPLDSLSTSQTHPFKDVPERAKSIITQLYQLKVMNGKTSTLFGSEAEITRGEAAILIAKSFNSMIKEYDTADVSKNFTDVTGRYVDSVNLLASVGVVSGKSYDKFGTHQPITRGELMVILHRLYKLENQDQDSGLGDSSTIDYPSSANGVTMSLDKEIYSPSETLKLTLTNTSEETYMNGFNKFELDVKKDGVWISVPRNPDVMSNTGILTLEPKDGVINANVSPYAYFESKKFPVGEYRLVQRFNMLDRKEGQPAPFEVAAEFKIIE